MNFQQTGSHKHTVLSDARDVIVFAFYYNYSVYVFKGFKYRLREITGWRRGGHEDGGRTNFSCQNETVQ